MSGVGGSVPHLLGTLRAAVAFLTRIPVGSRPISAADSNWAPSAFPLIGACVGALSGAAFHGGIRLGPLAAACLAVGLSLYITGAFHEDGLSDTADALWGAVSRERALEIMKDSRIGSYGAAALTLTLLARVALIAHSGAWAFIALVWAGCIARLGPVCLMTWLPHASPATSKHKDLLATPRLTVAFGSLLALGIGVVIGVMVPASGWRLAMSALGVAVTGAWFARLGKRRLGGVTGDLLGACEQVGEIAVLMVFAWHV
jgi:adenosylcobinamide-GDP ribazoletransferase